MVILVHAPDTRLRSDVKYQLAAGNGLLDHGEITDVTTKTFYSQLG